MKITREQVIKMNSKMSNGFSVDLWTLGVWGEKQCTKKVYIGNPENGEYVKFSILWHPEFEERKTAYGQSFNVKTGRSVPTLHLSRWEKGKTEGVDVSHGTGKYISIGEAQERKNFSVLQKLTATFTDEKIKEVMNEYVK